jgi:hypothetical protein
MSADAAVGLRCAPLGTPCGAAGADVHGTRAEWIGAQNCIMPPA